MSLDWKDAYKIGNEVIDSQHQEWFRLARNFLNATDKVELSACAMVFYKYTTEHFAHEDEVMKRLNYSERKAHLAQHSELDSLLGGVTANIDDQTLNMDDLKAFLSAWLVGHIGTFDKRLAYYVKSQEFGHSPNPAVNVR
jgi:hemerythrin